MCNCVAVGKPDSETMTMTWCYTNAEQKNKLLAIGWREPFRTHSCSGYGIDHTWVNEDVPKQKCKITSLFLKVLYWGMQTVEMMGSV